MAVAFDAKPTAWNSADGLNQQTDNGTVCSASTGFTVSGSASLVVGVIHYMSNAVSDPGAVSAWTWNGVSRTGLLSSAVNSRNRSAIAWWTSPASGSPVMSATVPNNSDMYMSAASFTGVDTTTPVVTADSVTGTTGTTVTVTSDANGATVAVWGTNGSTPTTNFNQIFAEAPLDPGAGASYQLGGTSNGHTFTGAGGTLPAWAGIHIQAAAGGAAVIRLFFPMGMDGLGGGIMGSNRLH
jgi:hypothetical protein